MWGLLFAYVKMQEGGDATLAPGGKEDPPPVFGRQLWRVETRQYTDARVSKLVLEKLLEQGKIDRLIGVNWAPDP